MNSVKKINKSALHAAIEQCEKRLCFSTFVVNTVSDAVNPGAGLTSLRQAITAANSNPGADAITFSPTITHGVTSDPIQLQQGELKLTVNTTITGPGMNDLTIDANHASRVFEIVSGATVSISGLTVTHGVVDSTGSNISEATGGGIASAGTLKLTNVSVTLNSASENDAGMNDNFAAGSAYGGGIYSTGALSLINSIVSGNTAQGGSKYYGTSGVAYGGGVYSSGPTTIDGTTIAGNVASGGNNATNVDSNGGQAAGGGLYIENKLTLTSSIILNNAADGGSGGRQTASMYSGGAARGGGIYVTGDGSMLFKDSINGNSATGGNSGGLGGHGGEALGGGILNLNSLSVISTLLSTNEAHAGNGPFDDNGPGANASGGAIDASGPLTLSSSSVISNSAQAGYGSTLYDEPEGLAAGGGLYASQSFAVISSTISGNKAEAGQSAGIYGSSGGTGLGGGIFAGGTSGSISNSTLDNNMALGGVGDGGDTSGFGGRGGDGMGGAIYNNAALSITNSTLAANSAAGGAGANNYPGDGGDGGNADGSAVYSTQGITVYDSTVSGNTTTGGAGGVAESPSNMNGADGLGLSAFTIFGSPAKVMNTIISGNTTDNGADENDVTADNTGFSFSLIGAASGLINGANGNIVGVNNPQLSPLGGYGGPTQTMLPLLTSPAVNAGNNSLIPSGVSTDQRGDARIFGSKVDIGADELETGAVSGTVYNDLNGDGIRQSGENGLSGVTVYADLSNAGFFKAGDPTAVTNSGGNYTLSGLPEGTVIIRQNVPSGYRQSYPIGGTGQHETVTPSGVTGVLFADSTRIYVSGTVTLNGVGQGGVLVYADLNKNGKFDSGENNKTTQADGSFTFVSLAPGTYTFRVAPPAGTVVSGNAAITATIASGGVDQNVSFTVVTQTNQRLTGTVIGTAGSYNNDGNTIAKVFDGNLATFFDAPTNAGNYAGLDLGTADIITQITYVPRPSYASRMVGGIFQGANSADFSSGVVNLFTITAAPVQGVLTTVPVSNFNAFRYVRYLAPAGSFGNVAEVQFFGASPATGATLQNGGVLVVNGTSGADTINIQINNEDTVNSDTVVATVNGVAQSFNLTNVLQIIVNAGAGNDTVTATGTDYGPADKTGHGYEAITINGGDGNDSLSVSVDHLQATAGQAILIDGGAGEDMLYVSGPLTATLVGGDGNDIFSSNGNPDGLTESVYGGAGNDSVWADGDTYVAAYDGGSGVNTLDFTEGYIKSFLDNTMVDLNKFVNVHNVILGGYGGTITGTSSADTITATNAGAVDVSITGGGGGDTISIDDVDSVNVTEAGFGGSNNISVTNSFAATVTGGNGNDTINVQTTRSATVDGGPGTDTAFVDPGDIVTNVEFINPGRGHPILGGTIIGTAGSYKNQGNTISKVFDGNLTNYFDAPVASGAWAGLDLGSINVATQVKYAPRVGFGSRMVGGQIQASNTADFSSGVATLYTITTAPASGSFTTQVLSNSTAYRYYRYIGPTNGSCNIAELEFDG